MGVKELGEVSRVNSCVGAVDRLLALSQGTKINQASQEWRHDGLCQNFEHPIAKCDLCTDQSLRFTFLIQNTVTGQKAWVGDKCLLALGIPIYQSRVRIPQHRARQHLAAQVQDLVTNQALSVCTMSAFDKADIALADALIQFRFNGRATIQEASLIFAAIEQNMLLTTDVMLPIYTRRDEDIAQLRDIPTWALWRFWHCLTPDQVKLAVSLGHAEPKVQHGTLVKYQRKTDLAHLPRRRQRDLHE